MVQGSVVRVNPGNKRTALILVAVALAFFVSIMLKYSLFK
jgi:hypothetical protein